VWALLLNNERHSAVAPARGTDRNLHVLSERDEEFHEALDGESAGAISHQGGKVRLPNAE
jgi:hypothetical protein